MKQLSGGDHVGFMSSDFTDSTNYSRNLRKLTGDLTEDCEVIQATIMKF